MKEPLPFKILIFDDNANLGDLDGQRHDGLQITRIENGTRAQLLDMISGQDAYVSSLHIRVDQEVLDAAGSGLKLVATNSTGTDHLDLDVLEQRGIAVISNKKDRHILDQVTATAELSFALLLSCARHLRECFESTCQGHWKRHALGGHQISGKTLGIIGLGRLGSMMAQYGRAFRMRILAVDPHCEKFTDGISGVDLDTLLRESDFVSIHVHLDEQTRGLLGRRELGLMKTGACLINTSRGGLIDEAALIDEMRGGRIAAAGLDVIDGEWLENKYDHPLVAYSRENPRLYITPHVGGATPESGKMTANHLFQKVVAFFQEFSQDARDSPGTIGRC